MTLAIYGRVWIIGKIDKKQSRLSQISQVQPLHGVGKMKTKGSKLLTTEKAKNDAHLHEGTTAGAARLNKGLRKGGGSRAQHGYHS